MPAYRFTGPYPVVLSELGLLVEPGDVAEFDEPPAGSWQPAAVAPPLSLPEPPASDKKKEG